MPRYFPKDSSAQTGFPLIFLDLSSCGSSLTAFPPESLSLRPPAPQRPSPTARPATGRTSQDPGPEGRPGAVPLSPVHHQKPLALLPTKGGSQELSHGAQAFTLSIGEGPFSFSSEVSNAARSGSAY